MRFRIAKSIVVAVLVCTLLVTPALANVQSQQQTHEADGVTMIVDLALLRPFGILATVLGSAAFIVALPFAALGGNVGEAADKLVADPFRYTFVRPLGHVE